MEDIIVPLGLFLGVVMIVMIAVAGGAINRYNMHQTVREAMRQGKTLDAEAIKALGAPRRNSGNNDLKTGLILIAVAAGLVVMGLMMGETIPVESDEPSPALMMAGIAAIPAFIGLVLAGFGVVSALRPPKQEG
ncbi:MAG: DUF6249 domain-containing protein [Glycocaulis sp.]